MPRIKIWKRLAAAAAAVVLSASILAGWQVNRLRESARSEVARVIGTAFDAQARVREVRVDWLRGGLVLRGLEVTRGERKLVQAGELYARPSLGPLLRGRLQLHAVSIPAAEVRVRLEDLRAMHGSGELALPDAVRIETLKLAIDLNTDSARPGELEFAHARLELASAGASRASFEVTAPSGKWISAQGPLVAREVKLNAARARGPWKFDLEAVLPSALDASLGEGSIRAHAVVAADAVSIELRPRSLALGPLLARTLGDGAVVHGALEGELVLRGTLSPLKLSGPAKLTARNFGVFAHSARSGSPTPAVGSKAFDAPQLSAAGDVTLDSSGVRLDPLHMEVGSSRLVGHAQLGLLATEFELRGSAIDLANFGPVWGVPIAGKGDVRISTLDDNSARVVHATLSLDAAAIGGRDLGRLTADLALDPATGVVTAVQAEAVSPERQVVAHGSTMRFGAAGLEQADAKLKLERLPLRELYRLLGAADDPVLSRMQGGAKGTAELAYRATGASALDVTLALQLSDIDLAGYPLDRGRVSARVSIPDRTLGLRGGTLRLSELSLGAANGKLELSGTMIRGLVDMKLSARGLPLERSPSLRGKSRTLLTGRIDGQGSLHGDASNVLGDLQLGIDDLRLLGEPLGRIQVQALLRPTASASTQLCPASRAALATEAFRGESTWLFCGGGWNDRLQIDLALGNGAARPIRGEVSLTDFALGPAVRGLQPSAAEAIGPGTLTAALAFEGGGLATPDHLTGTLRVRKIVLGSGDSRLENTAPFQLRAQNGALALDAARLEGPVQHYALSAAGSLGKTARFIADGQVGASTFTRDSEPVVKAFGDLGVHLEWTPAADEPLRGHAELRDLSVRGPAALHARHLRGTLRLAGRRLQLEGVEAELGSGKVGIAGHLELDGLRIEAYDLAIEAQRVAVEPEPLVRIELDAHTRLRWRGSASLPAFTGSLIVRHLAYGKALHLEALAAMNRTRPGPAARDRVELDLTVEHREPLRIRNTLLDGELAIVGADRRLRIVGTDRRLGVLGELAVTRGRILFQGDQFHFTRGDIALHDPARVAPHFDVRAVADQPRRKDTSVVLTARGTRDAFKVAIQCEASAAPVDAPPFTCNYAHDRMACDDFDRLVAQWSCPLKHATKASTSAR